MKEPRTVSAVRGSRVVGCADTGLRSGGAAVRVTEKGQKQQKGRIRPVRSEASLRSEEIRLCCPSLRFSGRAEPLATERAASRRVTPRPRAAPPPPTREAAP